MNPLRASLALLALSVALLAQAADFTNPILRGDWSDPGVVQVGGKFYSVRSSFGWQPGLPIVESTDLLHWRYIGHGFAAHPKLQPGDTRFGIWGVEMGFNPNTKEFLIYAPTRDGEVYCYHSDKPEGPYTVTSLGNLGIDPGFFADDDGRLYLLTNKFVIHELTTDGLHLKGEVVKLSRAGHRLFEGPDIFKHGGWYYLVFSDGGTLPTEPSTISTLRARALTGPWEEDPANPNMFSTNSGARFEAPAHATLLAMPDGAWYVMYHAHETAFYSLGRQTLLQPIEWTPDGWWRPVAGKIPAVTAPAPALPPCDYQLAQSDDFAAPTLGLQWFFTCAPDFSGKVWSLTERPGRLVVHAQPGDLGSLEALPAIFQQRVIDKQFSFETQVTFDAREGREAAGLHLYHDPLMNLSLASTVREGKKVFVVSKYNLGRRTELWTAPNNLGATVHLKIAVDGEESATFYFGPDGRTWTQLGGAVYFGASGYHLRRGERGDPDLGWVGRYKERGVPPAPADPRLPNRSGNIWTATTFGLFAVREGAAAARTAEFANFVVRHPAR